MEHILEIIGNTVTFVRTREYKGRSPWPTQVRDYLRRETLPRLCLLLVGAGEVNHACQNSPLKVEYKDLFETVLDRVGKLTNNHNAYRRVLNLLNVLVMCCLLHWFHIEHFNMTSRRPYWCTKITRETELNSFVPLNLGRC